MELFPQNAVSHPAPGRRSEYQPRIFLHHAKGRDDAMSIGTILLIILVLVLLGGVGGIGGSPFYGTGYYGGGGLGLVIVILLILVLMGRI
jgi:hypothetical protein